MALMNCKECTGTVSDRALNCPHCGISMNIALGSEGNTVVARWLFPLAIVVLLFLLIIQLLGG